MPSNLQVTYWYHPESDSFWIHNPETDPPLEDDVGDSMSVELDEYTYVLRTIERIDADPEHKLPDGISAVIKNAAEWPNNRISGFIWYDQHKRFPNDYPVNTSDIVDREPGGIYCTKNHKYLVLVIQPKKIGDTNG